MESTADRQEPTSERLAHVRAEALIDAFPEPVLALDADLRVVAVNQPFCDAFGTSPAQAGGQLFCALDDTRWNVPGLCGCLKDVLAARSALVDLEVEVTLPSLGRRTLLLNARRIGTHPLLLLSVEDVTQRRQAGRLLKRERDLARLYLEVAGVAMVVLDPRGHVALINPTGCRILQYPEDEIVGRNWFEDFLAPRLRVATRTVFRSLLSGETEVVDQFENVVRTRTGAERTLLWHATVLRDEHGDTIGVLGSGLDITDRQQAEQALAESRALAHAILNAAEDAVIVSDEQGRIESVNPAVERIFGYAAEEMVGRNVSLIMPLPYRREHDAYIRKYLKTGVARVIGAGRTLTARRKDGALFPVDVRLSEARLGGKRVFTAFLRDVSERQRLEREVLRISEEQRQEIGRDIHDGLASQFSGIALISRALLTRMRKDQPVQENALEEIAHLARSGAEQARTLARGLNPVKLEEEGLAAALRELVHTADTLSDAACTLTIDDDLPRLEPNHATQVYRIVQESVNNAVKHAHAGHIDVRVHRNSDRLVLSVRDDGVGLPENLGDRTGMGMHIMPYRAHMAGATLTIESSPGAGTAVSCSVPTTLNEPLQDDHLARLS